MRWFCLALLLSACATEKVGLTPPDNDLYFPAGIAPHPNGRYVYVVNNNADQRYNAATLVTIDLDAVVPGEENDHLDAILSDQTKRIQAYGAAPTFDGAHRRLFVPTREENKVFTFDLDDTGSSVSCGGGKPISRNTPCDADHVFQLSGKLFDSELSDADTAEAWTGVVTRPEPSLPGEFLFLTHLSAGVVSAYDITPNTLPEPAGNPKGFKAVTLLGGGVLDPPSNGIASIALANASGAKPMLYAGGNHLLTVRTNTSSASMLYFFEPRIAVGDGGVAGSLDLFQSLGGTTRTTDVMHMATNAKGDRLYAVTRNPNTLLVMDTSLGADGVPRNRFVSVVPVDRLPSYVTYVQETPYNRALLYVSCFSDGDVLIYDADTLLQIGKISQRQRGPFALATSYRPNAPPRVLLSLFNDDQVVIYDASLAPLGNDASLGHIGTVRSAKVVKQ